MTRFDKEYGEVTNNLGSVETGAALSCIRRYQVGA